MYCKFWQGKNCAPEVERYVQVRLPTRWKVTSNACASQYVSPHISIHIRKGSLPVSAVHYQVEDFIMIY
jgi:hypothetical protein